IPYGDVQSYGEVAVAIGEPNAARAVANACAQNPAAVVIPCHRVIRQSGDLGGYRWNLARKRALLDHERRARRGERLRAESRRRRHSVPPGHPPIGRLGGLPLESRAQARATRSRTSREAHGHA
ncbi:MAG: methylated-DNA--[protein]-cysteine S-methyltransferase, partial [Candidatus Cybelea sp.]